MFFENELKTAMRLSREAGEKVLGYYRHGVVAASKVGVDNHSEPVTVADIAASKVIVDGLRSAFPNDFVLSEEEPDAPAERGTSDRVWIIDPIDGTWGFIKQDGDFAIQIGLAVEGEPVVGAVYLPAHRRLYFGSKNGGAFVETDGGAAMPLRVSQNVDFSRMDMAVSRNHRSPKISRIMRDFGLRREVQRGSVGLKVGLVAEAVCDLYIHLSPRTKFWDTCGPQIILEEAGGQLTDLLGHRIRYDESDVQNHSGIVAANGAAHAKIIESLAPLLADFGRFRTAP